MIGMVEVSVLTLIACLTLAAVLGGVLGALLLATRITIVDDTSSPEYEQWVAAHDLEQRRAEQLMEAQIKKYAQLNGQGKKPN